MSVIFYPGNKMFIKHYKPYFKKINLSDELHQKTNIIICHSAGINKAILYNNKFIIALDPSNFEISNNFPLQNIIVFAKDSRQDFSHILSNRIFRYKEETHYPYQIKSLRDLIEKIVLFKIENLNNEINIVNNKIIFKTINIMNNNEEKTPNLKVKKLTQSAEPPKRSSEYAAGYDLYADLKQEAFVIPASTFNQLLKTKDDHGNSITIESSYGEKSVQTGKLLVNTGISVAIPKGYYGRIASRSGLAVKNDIEVGAGVIDSDYRGEIKVLLRNLGSKPFEFRYGDRIAQLIIEKIITPDIEIVSDLDETVRNDGGFGSTGVSLTDVSLTDVSSTGVSSTGVSSTNETHQIL